MARKPNYIMKPAHFSVTEWGFRDNGEGIVVEYEKGNPIVGNKLRYFMLIRNRGREHLFVDRTKNMSADQARRNISVRDDFTMHFKRDLFKLLFKTKKSYVVDNISNFTKYI